MVQYAWRLNNNSSCEPDSMTLPASRTMIRSTCLTAEKLVGDDHRSAVCRRLLVRLLYNSTFRQGINVRGRFIKYKDGRVAQKRPAIEILPLAAGALPPPGRQQCHIPGELRGEGMDVGLHAGGKQQARWRQAVRKGYCRGWTR